MNAPQSFSTPDAATVASHGRQHTPADLELVIRDRRFGRDSKMRRWWMGGDPIGTAFYNALSITFPKGEAFFIESVKAFREGTPERLASEIRAFVKQEINHTREHVAFNRRVVEAGYDVKLLEEHVDQALALTKGRPQIANLASTMALEHFTAILAQQLLANPKHLETADAESRDLWRWHAMEEIEHKGVAFDTWNFATKDWSRWQRWKVKSLIMLVVTKNFLHHRAIGMLELLRQDGFTGPKVWAQLFWYAFGNPGMARKIILPWMSYFLPGFHPWKHDDRHLIQLAESDYQDAVMAKGEPALVPAE